MKRKTQNVRLVEFIHYSGKPRVFPLEADLALIKWIEGPNTLIIEKKMHTMTEMYQKNNGRVVYFG